MNERFLNIFTPPELLKKIQSMHWSVFLLVFLMLSGCKTSNTRSDFLPAEDYQSLESLFSHLLFYESGAYTLFGSKPISFEPISEVPIEEKQELLAFSSHPIIKDMVDFPENWKTWERLKKQYPMSRFLLFQRNSPPFSPIEKSVFIVNIATTAEMLQKYYAKFRAAVSQDFDPLDIVFEIQDDHSEFWNKILAREDLFGILLGFGEENAWFFTKVKAWQEQENHTAISQKDAFLTSLATLTPGSNSLVTFDPSFPIPGFSCYAEEESLNLIKRYENERRMIKKIYREKDFVQITLDRLTSRDLPTDPDRVYIEKMTKELRIQDQPSPSMGDKSENDFWNCSMSVIIEKWQAKLEQNKIGWIG